ncbi:hypothetical protein LDENG_00166780 [Lucifuga dentata]|nr:hypothetical protein LDENG_00166780 [Lucifuga dentata]
MTNRCEVESFVSWCDENFLILNVGKTKELIGDFRKKKEDISPMVIMDQQIERVESYKYLGVRLDNKLKWKNNTNILLKKAQSPRLFFLRKLRSFNVCNKVLLFFLFYQGILVSVLFYAVLCWDSTITLEDRNRINELIKKAGSVIGMSPDSLEVILQKRTKAKLYTVLKHKDYPLYNVFNTVFSGRLVIP